MADQKPWALEECLGKYGQTDPSILLEELFADPRCVAFGPIHHFLVGACLLTAYASATNMPKAQLEAHLTTLADRAECVPGATCARWGICGASISTGMAYALIADNAPLKAEGWGEGQKLVSDVTLAIVDAGSPRCCKRDSRIAVEVAARSFESAFNMHFGEGSAPAPAAAPALAAASTPAACAFVDRNSVCLHERCPYYAPAEKEA